MLPNNPPVPAVPPATPKVNDVQDTLNSRQKTHGNFDTQARTSQKLKDAIHAEMEYNEHMLLADQLEALDMICVKISRILHGNPHEPDHWHDIAGYATLVANRLSTGKSHLDK